MDYCLHCVLYCVCFECFLSKLKIKDKFNVSLMNGCYRVIPLTIVFYRYLMVCHVDFCLEKGEHKIRKILLQMCLVFPIFVGSLSLFHADNMRDSVMCNGREEKLLFNTNNFIEDISYDGSVINLPFHHPYKIFGLFMRKCVSNYKDANI